MNKRFVAIISAVVVAIIITACHGGGGGGGFWLPRRAAKSSAKEITGFSFTNPAATGIIDENGKTIAVAVPFGTNVSALVAVFSTTGASVTVGATEQVSGTTPNNFTDPVQYTVTAQDSSTATYTVTVARAASVINLPKTGQVVSYATSTTHDDGKLQKGIAWPVPRFTVGTDAEADCVIDNLTGLMWAKDAALNTAPTKTWQEALEYVATTVNSGPGLCGHVDWRLPNIKELRSLADYSQSYPVLQPGHPFINIQPSMPSMYWSSTTQTTTVNKVWILDISDGSVYSDLKSNSFHVWPVRSGPGANTAPAVVPKTGQTFCYAAAQIDCIGTGQDGNTQAGTAWPATRFISNTDTTITDNLTGLVWPPDSNSPGPVACNPGTTKTWQEALDYTECLNSNVYLGKTDWRLPNVNELESLAHLGFYELGYGTNAGWLAAHGFSSVLDDYYWSSTTNPANTGYAFGMYMDYGTDVSAYDKTQSHRVWPVSGGQ